jgi:hypothetical protein
MAVPVQALSSNFLQAIGYRRSLMIREKNQSSNEATLQSLQHRLTWRGVTLT